jgi:hypothetical protein
MTDEEFYMIINLFDRKEFNVNQIESLDQWVMLHEENPIRWVSPGQLIETLNDYYRDRDD